MVLGIFLDKLNAENAISDLEAEGYNPKDISIIMKDQIALNDLANRTGSNIAEGAVSGAATGGVVGGLTGLLIGIGEITIPGIGALLIGGPIASALGLTGVAATAVSGAATGALTGGLIGALIGLGVPENEARIYEERIRKGGILVAVPTTLRTEDEVREILLENGADQVSFVDESRIRASRGAKEPEARPAFFNNIRRRR